MNAAALSLFSVIAALVVGLGLRQLMVRRNRDREIDTLSASDWVTALSTVAILIVAFIMVAAFESWADAGAVTAEESQQVVTMARHARFLPDDEGKQITAELLCYARSVEHYEWQAMSERASSAVTDHWLVQISETIESHHEDEAIEQIVDLEATLDAERHRRLADALPSVPDAMYAFMVLTIALTVFSIGYFTSISRAEPGHLALALVATAILVGPLAIVRDMDSPYSGLSTIKPAAIRHAQEQIGGELDSYDKVDVPCDKRGLPPGLEARREAITH